MEAINELTARLKQFPGIGLKSARRIAFFLVNQDNDYLSDLGELISTLRKDLYTCSQCGNVSNSDPCDICSDPLRDRKTLCIVEDIEALSVFEEAGVYDGLYHVLGKISPLRGNDIDDEAFNFLAEHINNLEAEEVIIATNPKVEGEMTYYELVSRLKQTGVQSITRIAYGLPVGGSVAFADRTTISTALSGRKQVD